MFEDNPNNHNGSTKYSEYTVTNSQKKSRAMANDFTVNIKGCHSSSSQAMKMKGKTNKRT